MTVPPIDPYSKKDPNKKTTPNVGRFKKEVEKVEKASETEFEKPKQKPAFEEEKEEPQSPFEMMSKEKIDRIFQKPLVNALQNEKDKRMPQSKEFYEHANIQIPAASSTKKKQTAKETEEKIQLKENEEERPFLPNERPIFSKEKKEIKTKAMNQSDNIAVYKMDLQSLPDNIKTESLNKIASISPSTSLDLTQLTEKMVGVMLHSTQEGITRTEVILNSPDMQGSIFYGATITVEKYAIAPDSFNIHLTGSPEAVNVFNSNIDGLMQTFQMGNFDFRIGTLSAEYALERPLFHRKERSKGKGSGGADTTGGRAR